MENAKIMKHRNTSRAGVKQTSTPLNNNKGVVFFKTLSNVSSIRNKCTEIRHSYIESPSIFDWENPSQSPGITDSYNYYSESPEEVCRRRPDTPLKSPSRSRLSNAPILCPVKLRFSKVSTSSNVNSKLSDIKKRYSSTVSEYLYANKKPGSDNAEREHLKIIKTHELRNTSVEQQTGQVCKVSLGQQVYAKFNEKNCGKSAKIRSRCERNQVIIDRDIENEVDIHSGVLTSSRTSLTENAYVESFDFVKSKSTRKEVFERKRKTSQNRTKRQRNDINISNDFINETDSLDESAFNSGTHITGTTHHILRAGSKKRNVESGKEQPTKSKRKREERQEQEKKTDKAESKGSVDGVILYSNNIQFSSSKEEVDKVKIFKKPFMFKKRTISKRVVMANRRNVGLFPPTSTPMDSPATTNQKLPLLFESLSPVRSSEKTNKSCFSDDLKVTRIKAKRTYAKKEKINSKLDKEISKWESFLKKSSYRKKNNNYVSETSILKNSDGSIHLFESPPINVNEGTTVDTFPKSSSKRRKVSEGKSGQNAKENLVTAERVKAKKWFATTKIMELADHFNEISQVSLVIENKRKKF